VVVSKDKSLKLVTTANQDSPLSNGEAPLFGIDLWEHAYYLKHQNRRADYVQAVSKVLNWEFIEARFEKLTGVRDVLWLTKRGRRETFVPRRPRYARSTSVRCYVPQHPEPQHPSCSAFTPAVGHSSSQQTQVQLVHSQLPVSQQPQQSHVSQPARWLLRVAGTKGTKASAARRNRLFMGRILCLEN
jgi:hypothetical protein